MVSNLQMDQKVFPRTTRETSYADGLKATARVLGTILRKFRIYRQGTRSILRSSPLGFQGVRSRAV